MPLYIFKYIEIWIKYVIEGQYLAKDNDCTQLTAQLGTLLGTGMNTTQIHATFTSTALDRISTTVDRNMRGYGGV